MFVSRRPRAGLRQLAAITDFDLFVTTTFDSLLESAINRERFGGSASTEVLSYAPNRVVDLPSERDRLARPVIYHLFGKLLASPTGECAHADLQRCGAVRGRSCMSAGRSGRRPQRQRVVHPVALAHQATLLRAPARFAGTVATALSQPVFNEVERWAPRMDFADACAVVLVRNYERAFVLTTDFRDFAAYRVPFASPEGAFHV